MTQIAITLFICNISIVVTYCVLPCLPITHDEALCRGCRVYQCAYDRRVQTLGSQHPRTIACGNHLLALQQERKRVALKDI
jgi:hypothetical protein